MSWEDEYADSLMYKLSKAADGYARGHTWKRDDIVYPDGYVGVDMFALEDGYCNGPECESCGFSFCHHCTGLAHVPPCPNPRPDLMEALLAVVRAKRG